MVARRQRFTIAVTTAVLVSSGAVVGAAATPVTDRAAATGRADRGDAWSLADAPERVVLMTDSAIAGIRWTGNLERLVHAGWDDRLESCRRLVRDSCRGREGYRPLTAVRELQAIAAQFGTAHPDEVLVMAVGYNDWHEGFQSDFDTVMAEARRAGFRHVAWMTYRENNTYRLPGDLDHQVADYAAMNRVLRSEHASGRWPELTLFDYDDATRDLSPWFTSDGVHLTPDGARGVADWLSGQILFSEHPEFAPANWVPPSER